MPREQLLGNPEPGPQKAPTEAKKEKTATPENIKENDSGKALSSEQPKSVLAPASKSIVVSSQIQDFEKKRLEAIDIILAEGLNEVFLKMKAEEQKEFKQKGEETVVKINELLKKTKVKVNKIIDLIRDWLKLIPGVNKFFLEQEAKIKADKIIRIKDKF